MDSVDILQGCNRCNPRHPIAISAFATLVDRLEKEDLVVVWYANPNQSLPYFDDVLVGCANGPKVHMPVIMLTEETRIYLLRIAATLGRVNYACYKQESGQPNISLSIPTHLIRSFFDTTLPTVKAALALQDTDSEFLNQIAEQIERGCIEAAVHATTRLKAISARIS